MTDAPRDTPDIRAAEYVLRLMPADEESRFEDEMARSPELSSEVAGWLLHFEGLNDGFEPQKPRKAVRKELMDRLFGDVTEKPSFLDRVALWRGLSLASLTAVAVLALLAFQPPAPPPQGPTFVSEIAAPDDSLRLLAVYDGAQDRLQVTRTAGAARPGRVLELWAIPGDNAPVSLGVLPEDGRATLTLPAELAAQGPLVLAISDEPPGGSPTGAPTGDVLALGEAVGL